MRIERKGSSRCVSYLFVGENGWRDGSAATVNRAAFEGAKALTLVEESEPLRVRGSLSPPNRKPVWRQTDTGRAAPHPVAGAGPTRDTSPKQHPSFTRIIWKFGPGPVADHQPSRSIISPCNHLPNIGPTASLRVNTVKANTCSKVCAG